MRITTANIPADESVGLKKINMSKLGNLVLIAGKNGSGKSRLLSKIKTVLHNKPNKYEIAQANQNISSMTRTIQHAQESGENAHSIPAWQNVLDQAKNTLRNNLLGLDEEIDTEHYISFEFVPKQINLNDPHSMNKAQIIGHASNIQQIDITHIQDQTLPTIQHIQDQWFNATHPNSTIPHERKKEIITSYEKLCEYIKLFLDTELDRDENGDATLFKFRIGDAKLSDGQKIILQFCISIYSKEAKLSDLILMMDEPENHLHPDALISLIDKLVNIVTNGQIWVATHSINLLAHFDPKYIWYIEDGDVGYAGNKPKTVLNGLLGNEDEIEKLSNFLSLPAIMATNQFAFECLFAPQTVTTGNDDPQTNQIIENIQRLLQNQSKVKVLDFGAGKGRLLTTIRELNIENGSTTASWLDYYAFDLSSEDNTICESVIESIYNNDRTRFFSTQTKFIEETESNSFDIIIMCNVFHEIHPKDWLNIFNKHSIFAHALKEDGILLIVEDQLLAVGEKAYQNGFMVLDKIQFKKLFQIPENYIVHDARGDGRLKAHYIQKSYLENITHQTRSDAIASLHNTATQEIARLRSPDQETSYKNGKLHGFWVQQLANAQLALNELR